uniref:erythroid membrane-associated protein isoform X2 n=1 Tax=Halichoerus grypus TaxID=9711 RepID=UPI001659CAEF|nr:erythroid membrane-associated protein isoform X2 [Halichoerus grypus]
MDPGGVQVGGMVSTAFGGVERPSRQGASTPVGCPCPGSWALPDSGVQQSQGQHTGECVLHRPQFGPWPREDHSHAHSSPISREDLLLSSGSCCDPACPGDYHHGGHIPHLEAKKIKREASLRTGDGENLLSDHAKEKGRLHKALKKLRSELKLKRAAANSGWRRARLHFVAVTLDPDTAHPKLILSEDRRCVKLGDRRQPVPDGPQRFDFVVSVLGAEYFVVGCHYWEVDVGNKTKWALGVCSESVSRKGKVTATPANGHWLVRQSSEQEYEALTSPQTTLRLKEPPRCVGIFLDYEAGIVSFYNVTSRSHIFTFTHTFSGPLRPFFEPCLHDGGKNTAPLIICSELQKSEPPTGHKPGEKDHANGDVAMNVDPSLLPPQAPEPFPPGDMILPWPTDLAPALQGLKVPSF